VHLDLAEQAAVELGRGDVRCGGHGASSGILLADMVIIGFLSVNPCFIAPRFTALRRCQCPA
jgi:hypothetical protein